MKAVADKPETEGRASVAERKVDELSRQLEEERSSSRRTISKLQRELVRLKSERAHSQTDVVLIVEPAVCNSSPWTVSAAAALSH
ncbi:hypothetical protein ACOMHN_009889 [Nucella lapillus]